MEKTFLKAILVFGIALAASGSASAQQVYVKVRPVAPVIRESPRPGPTHVWIGEEWREEGGSYRYAGGHWEAPPHPGERWVPGHWAHEGRGEFWVRGHWGR